MVDPNPIRRTDAGALGAAGAGAPGKPAAANTQGSGPAFRALMEKLAEQAKTLQQESESVAKPDQLSGAVDLISVGPPEAVDEPPIAPHA